MQEPAIGASRPPANCRRLFRSFGIYCREISRNAASGNATLIATEPFIRAQSVGVTYEGAIAALSEIGLEIMPGQFVSIIGPSGCGKSTLLRLLAGLIEPTQGLVTVDGRAPREARRSARLSFVFQDATLLPWRSVRGNVELPLELQHAPRRQRDDPVSRVLNMVGLSDFERQYPDQLSGGMRMRASLARALVTEPSLLLLDEPFGSLDDITRQLLNEELAALWSLHRWTGIFVTHNIAEAVFLSERILVMSARPGRIVADLTIRLESPRKQDVRAHSEFARLTGEVAACLRRAAA
jgi:NitT/TauT family transport system ATP-binding protein